jgi:hypothetical protein
MSRLRPRRALQPLKDVRAEHGRRCSEEVREVAQTVREIGLTPWKLNDCKVATRLCAITKRNAPPL